MTNVGPTEFFDLRIVYDGPSRAGKTTTLRTLARLLGVKAHTPKEVGGRTLYFDWLNYEGGRFRGRSLRCRLYTVPGQRTLNARRRRLLAEADAVVFVVESSEEGLQRASLLFDELLLDSTRASPRVSFLVEANKSDVPDALSVAEVRRRLGIPDFIPVARTVATSGDGVRETFVRAVRLALERLAVRIAADEERRLEEPIDPTDLLIELQSMDIGTGTDYAEERVVLEPSAREPGPEFGPSEESGEHSGFGDLPVGHIWPPIGGREMLNAARPERMRYRHLADGSLLAIGRHWVGLAETGGDCASREVARSTFLDWVRWHVRYQEHLTTRVLALRRDPKAGFWRQWQFVPRTRAARHDPNPVPAFLEGVVLGARRWQSEDGRLLFAGFVGHEMSNRKEVPG